MPQFENFMAAVKKLAISDTEKDTQKTLQQIEIDFPSQAVDYFKTQWWDDRERWVELHVRKHLNFKISTNSRVEGSHAALEAVLTSSSGTLFTALIGSSENLIVKTAVKDQIETAGICTKISRSALDLLHAEVMKKLHNQEEAGSSEHCNCDIYRRYLLPCSHKIRLGVPIDVQDIHPRWLIQQPNILLDLSTPRLCNGRLTALKMFADAGCANELDTTSAPVQEC
ncbi:hypothetical protein V1506DRAFT_555733 [Lipomyces tetrasporus]